MPIPIKIRKRTSADNKQSNGLYIHSSPPRVLQLNSAHVKQLIRSGDVDKLEQLVIDGHGKKLVGEYSPDYKTRTFLKNVPGLMTKISLLHDAVNSGRLEELQSLLDEETPEKRKKMVMAKDESGVGLLHKAIYYDLKDIYKYLIEKFPHIVHMKDAEGRTAYHYTPMCKDATGVQKLLVSAGADSSAADSKQHTAKYFMNHVQELELPSSRKTLTNSSKNGTHQESLNFKKSNIRIWIHQRNLANLQQVVWEGHGSKLLVEHSNNSKIKKFLEAVPHIMGLIKDIHTDVLNDELENLQKRVTPPIPPIVLSGKDANGLTALHKASGLGKEDIAEFIVSQYPNSVNLTDAEGRTPLHYAALAKDDGKMINFLLEHGADESALDNKQKTAAYYKTRTSELDAKLLNVIPECPRTAKEAFLSNFDWSMLAASTPTPTEETQKVAKKIVNGTHEKENDEEKPTPSDEQLPGEDNEENQQEGVETEANQENEKEAEDKGEKEETNGDANNNESEKNNANNEEKTEEAKDEKENAKQEENAEQEVKEPESEVANEPEVTEEKEPEACSEELKESENHESEDKETQQQDTEPLQEAEDEKPQETEPEKSEEPEASKENVPDSSEEKDKEASEEQQTKPSEEKEPEPAETKNDESEEKDGEKTEEESRPKSSAKSRKSRPASAAVEETNSENNKNNEQPTEIEPEGVIEGVVNGENEVETLNEEGQGIKTSENGDDNVDDAEITAMIDAGNMEQLAALVLNGEGDRLIGQTSNNPELQSFLDNVQVYMSKINRIHVAARDGSLRDLQAALDRRKFAIAKDKISPNGASPLHTAVTFGNTSIVRYLAGRFPETAQVTDDNGRTPLHYAAVLADNGHYYNLLIHLGADSRAEDKFGHTPEYYRTHQEEFSHQSLLRDFGAEENVVDEMLSDKVPNDTCSARKDLDDEDMLNVLERCYNVLHGRRNSNAVSAASTASTLTHMSCSSSIITKNTKRYIFDSVKKRLTKLDHNLYDVIWPSVKKLPSEMSFRVALEQDFPAGIVAPDFYAYTVFADYIEPIIKDYNAIDLHTELGTQPETKFQEGNKTIDSDFDLDPQNRWILSGNVVPNNGNNNQVDMPFFATEEGRYLASSLGDPLIKGLTEVANKRPEDPIAYLATYLYNFANNRQNVHSRGKTQENQQTITGPPQDADNNNAVPASIEVVTVDPEDGTEEEDSAFNSTSRDEHGQSMLHFAAARAHGRNALFQLLMETEINVAYRDELYRTARDISIQANIPENTAEIDRYVMSIATKGDTDKLVELLLDGYDHITDIVDENDVPIIEAVAQHEQPDTVSFLQSILAFEEKRERVHHAIRLGSINDVTSLLADENDTGSGKLLAIGKNNYGRCSLHIAVLCQQEEIVDYLANTFPDTLKLGDNLERTALHYAMGVENMETISRVLIKAGAKRIVKDLKGRQPTYYFLNKSDILRLQEEEETF